MVENNGVDSHAVYELGDVTAADGYRFDAGLLPLTGFGRVSGTSYSAPHLAAILAGEVARTGRTAADVWAMLVRPAGIVCSHSGGGVAVSLVSLTASPLDAAPPGTVARC